MASVPLNTTNELGIVLEYLTYNVTGDILLSLMFLMLVVMALALAFRIPIEWTAIIILPMCIVVVAFTSQFLPVLGFLIFYMAILIGKNWLYGGA